MVIDDNENVREVLAVYLEHEKIDYKMLDNGMEGLEAIEKGDYDFIFLDIVMPEFSGLDIIRSLNDDGLFQSKNIRNDLLTSSQVQLSQLE